MIQRNLKDNGYFGYVTFRPFSYIFSLIRCKTNICFAPGVEKQSNRFGKSRKFRVSQKQQ